MPDSHRACSVAVWALIEVAFSTFVERFRLWRKDRLGFHWVPNSAVAIRINDSDAEEKRILEHIPTILPETDQKDLEEVKRLFGIAEGNLLNNVDYLRDLSMQHPNSFVVRYLLGAALEEKN